MKIDHNFLIRGLTTLILAPVIIWGVLSLGPSYYAGIFKVLMIVGLWEWARLCGYSGSYGALLGGLFSYLDIGQMALVSIPFIIISLMIFRQSWQASLLFVAGSWYIGLACLQLISIFVVDQESPHLLLWMLLLVWAADIGAYLVGRWLRGPLFAPRISPGKTWSGFWGGTLSGILISTSFIYLTDLAILYSPWIYGWGVILTLVAPLGDLLESACKRYFKAKDTGALIPGHGGVLDRLDSFLAVALVLKGFLILKNHF
jgi:phosphatidate cytidylyltransferase